MVQTFLHHLTHPELHRQIRDEMACPTNRRTDTDPENVWRNGVSKKLLQMEIAALIRIHYPKNGRTDTDPENVWRNGVSKKLLQMEIAALIRIHYHNCLLDTSDAADALPCVDLCGRRTIKKKNNHKT